VDPIVQEANIRALKGGMTTDIVFDFLASIRSRVEASFVISTYANVVLSYGAARFARRCREVGVGGLIVPDMPFEERQEFLPQCQAQGIDLICMVAVTSQERVAAIAREATGFLYIMACPGTREEELRELMALARENSSVPCVVCLTGTESCRFRDVAARTDGVVVDVPIVSLMAQHGPACAQPISAFVARMKSELRAI
jgi:tryptophan synthase alpha chain